MRSATRPSRRHNEQAQTHPKAPGEPLPSCSGRFVCRQSFWSVVKGRVYVR